MMQQETQEHASKKAKVQSTEAVPMVADMSRYHYDCPDASVAKHPPNPRGSSKMLVMTNEFAGRRCQKKGELQGVLFENIRNVCLDEGCKETVIDTRSDEDRVIGCTSLRVADLPDLLRNANAHLVFNESKVYNARLFVTRYESQSSSQPFEAMFLAPEADSDTKIVDTAGKLQAAANGQLWRVMLRKSIGIVRNETVLRVCTRGQSIGLLLGSGKGQVAGDTTLDKSAVLCDVAEIHSIWKEEDEEDGLEVTLRIRCDVSNSLEGKLPLCMGRVFELFGHVPIPPYLNRGEEASDESDYQTVFCRKAGSVAAPTAGLHFTDDILRKLKLELASGGSGATVSHVDLCVGAGTFRPVAAKNVKDHTMHEEEFEVEAEQLRSLCTALQQSRPIIPVGTTSVRVLESLYWAGVKLHKGILPLSNSWHHVAQWDPYELTCVADPFGDAPKKLPSALQALEALLKASADCSQHDRHVVRGATQLCIVPGYRFHICDALVTNFHQPDSTLILLVAALVDRPLEMDNDTSTILNFYRHALKEGYKFFSYGDSSLLLNLQN